MKLIYLLTFTLLISACGGGDSSPPPALTFTPAKIEATLGEGESLQVEVVANLNTNLSGAVYVFISDPIGVITTDFTFVDNGNNTYTATIQISPSLPVGDHQGNIEVKLCQDFVCSSQHPGSPSLLPYSLNIISMTNLTPLSKLAGVNNWETYQANGAHTGYIPVTLDASKFNPRWLWKNPIAETSVSPVVTANDVVYTSVSGFFASNSALYAINESDKSSKWQHDFGGIFTLNPPAVTNGKVYAATTGHSDTFMWSFAADTGTQQFKTAFSSQWEHYYAPVVDNGLVLTNGGYAGGINAFSTTDGTSTWFTNLHQYDEWTPAVDTDYIYAYLGESCGGCNNAGLSIVNKTDGTVAATIIDPDFDWSGWSIKGAPMVGSSDSVFMINGVNQYVTNRFIRFNINKSDIGQSNINWSIAGYYTGQPAQAKGVVYVANNNPYQLEARDEVNGNLLWSWQPAEQGETSFTGNIVVTNNLVFVSTNKNVHAIDISSHNSVWKYWNPGELAISANGILYIAVNNGLKGAGYLTAFNLH